MEAMFIGMFRIRRAAGDRDRGGFTIYARDERHAGSPGTLPDKISHDDMVQATCHGSKQHAAASEGCHIALPVQGCF
jgi:hypothetical protein